MKHNEWHRWKLQNDGHTELYNKKHYLQIFLQLCRLYSNSTLNLKQPNWTSQGTWSERQYKGKHKESEEIQHTTVSKPKKKAPFSVQNEENGVKKTKAEA